MLRNTEKGWYGFCIIPLSFCVFSYFTGKYSLDITIYRPILPLILLNFILILAAYFLIFRFFRQTREQLTLQNEQNLLQMQVVAAQMHLEDLKESQEKTIIYRHDMRHHLALIDGYLAGNNREDARKYIADVKEKIEGAAVEKYCNNYRVNLILYRYIAMAKNEGISVETQIDLPEKTTVSDMDLCVIFANVIENAVNACKRIPYKNQRYIKIVCKTKNDQLFIQINNSYEGTVMFDNDLPVSTKENHGLGTKSIATVVKKYSGVYSFTAENGVFKTSIIL
jgi:sensor histidine kinase regulating citrate/malate metabolism